MAQLWATGDPLTVTKMNRPHYVLTSCVGQVSTCTTAAQTFINYSVSANTLNVRGLLRYRMAGIAGAATPTVIITFGGSTLFNNVLAGGLTGYRLTGDFISNTSSCQLGDTQAMVNGQVPLVNTIAATLDLTSAQTFLVTITATSTASTIQSGTLEVLTGP